MRVETIFVGLPGRRSLSLRVSPSRAPVLSCAHYFQSGIFNCVNGWCRRTKFCLPQNCRLNIRMAEEHLITCISMEKVPLLKTVCLFVTFFSFLCKSNIMHHLCWHSTKKKQLTRGDIKFTSQLAFFAEDAPASRQHSSCSFAVNSRISKDPNFGQRSHFGVTFRCYFVWSLLHRFAFFLLATWPDSFAVNFDWFIFSNALKKLVSAFALDTLFPARLSHIFCSGRHSYNICSASRGFRRSSLNLFRFFLGRLGCLINSTFQNIIYFIYFSHAISTVVYITNSQWPALHLAWFTS